MYLSMKDKDRLLAACQASVMRVAKDLKLPLVFPATLGTTDDREYSLEIKLRFDKEQDHAQA